MVGHRMAGPLQSPFHKGQTRIFPNLGEPLLRILT